MLASFGLLLDLILLLQADDDLDYDLDYDYDYDLDSMSFSHVITTNQCHSHSICVKVAKVSTSLLICTSQWRIRNFLRKPSTSQI